MLVRKENRIKRVYENKPRSDLKTVKGELRSIKKLCDQVLPHFEVMNRVIATAKPHSPTYSIIQATEEMTFFNSKTEAKTALDQIIRQAELLNEELSLWDQELKDNLNS